QSSRPVALESHLVLPIHIAKQKWRHLTQVLGLAVKIFELVKTDCSAIVGRYFDFARKQASYLHNRGLRAAARQIPSRDGLNILRCIGQLCPLGRVIRNVPVQEFPPYVFANLAISFACAVVRNKKAEIQVWVELMVAV